MVLSVKTKRNSEPQPFPCQVPCLTQQWAHIFPILPFITYVHIEILLSVFWCPWSDSVKSGRCPSWQHLCLKAASILFPDHLSLLPPSICFFFCVWVCSGDPSSSINSSWHFWLTFWCRSGLRTIKSKPEKVFSKWSTQQCNPWVINSQNYAQSF